MDMKLAKKRFDQQKYHATQRKIDFLLTFEEWIKIWLDSEKYDMRGGGGDNFCMMRLGDTGPYSIDNVKIGTNSENISEASKGRKQSEETKRKRSVSCTGVKRSEEDNKKLSDRMKLWWSDPINKQKQVDSHTGKASPKKGKPSGVIPWNKGQPMTDDLKQKISESKKGKPQKIKNIECPHCGKIGRSGNMKTWHFDNCKSKK